MKIENIIGNPWDNVYWFARMLINFDKYGGVGTDSNWKPPSDTLST